MKKTKIIYYIFPFHIDLLEKTIYQLKRAANYSNTKDYLSIEVVLDMSEKNIDWSNCKIPKQYFIDKFEYIETYCDFFENVNFELNDQLLGSGGQHRRTYDNNNGEYNIIALDPDICFPTEILYILENIIPTIEKESSTYMITPQIPKWWDSSWNIISNKQYINSPVKFDDINPFELDKCDVENIGLTKNYNHKFAGGWFNFYSAELTKLMKMPKNIGIFHHQDFYLQEMFKILNQKGYDIPQYIIQNCLVSEDRKYYHENEFLHKKYLPYQKNRPHMEGSENIFKEVIKELNKLKNE